MTTWTRPPAGIDGTWFLLRDRRGRLRVAGEAVAAEFAEDGPPVATGTFDEMTDLAREHNLVKVQAVTL